MLLLVVKLKQNHLSIHSNWIVLQFFFYTVFVKSYPSSVVHIVANPLYLQLIITHYGKSTIRGY